MQQPLRGVPGQGIPEDAPYTVRVATRSHLALTASPGTTPRPVAEAVHIPVTGHNLLFTLTAAGPERVTVRRIVAEVTERTALVADGVSIMHRRVPDVVLSPDLLESVQRSAEAYRPLEEPEFGILLDEDPAVVRPVGDAARSFPLTVEAGRTETLVLAPVTGARQWTHWRLRAEIECDGRTATPSWELTVTATTGMSKYSPGGSGGLPITVRELFPDHWDPDPAAPAPGEAAGPVVIAGHAAASGEGLLRGAGGPGPAPDPEPRQAAAQRELGDRHLAQGRPAEAVTAYRAAAEEGSGPAAFALGKLLHDQGELAGAAHWYARAAELWVVVAYNNLGIVALQRGDLDEAERWYLRAMDEGDWAAAVGLGALMARRGDATRAETLWRLAAENGAASATQNLAVLLNDQGRTAEAGQLWARAAADGDPEAALRVGFREHEAGNPAEAERWWREAAEKGHSRAAYYLGLLLDRSGRTPEAERWWREAAERLGPAPEAFAGSRTPHATGTGTTYSLGSAPDSGEALSAHHLGEVLHGRGDTAGAEHWWTLAARAGKPESALRLAESAYNERGDLQDFLRWTRIAVDNPATPPSHLGSVAEALRLLTADLADPRDPQPAPGPVRPRSAGQALALEACGLAADVHLRLYAHDEAAHRQDYERALAELVSLGLAAGDQDTANAALDRLSRLRRS
jgi:TPR repeat protein